MKKEVEIYNKWFQDVSDYTQANILNAITEALQSTPSNVEGKEDEFQAEWEFLTIIKENRDILKNANSKVAFPNHSAKSAALEVYEDMIDIILNLPCKRNDVQPQSHSCSASTSLPEEVGAEEMKDDLVMWDAINGDFYEHDNLDSVLKDLKENYCDPEEGIHPDIETIRIFKEVADVEIEQVEGKDTYRVKVIPRNEYASSLLTKRGAEIADLESALQAEKFAHELTKEMALGITKAAAEKDSQLQSSLDKANEEIGELRKIITAEVEISQKYKALAEAAEAYIQESPCDPDITKKQFEAYNFYENLKQQL